MAISERAAQLKALNDVSNQLASQQQDLEKLLELITNSAVRILNAEAGSLLLTAQDNSSELEFTIAVGAAGHDLIGKRLELLMEIVPGIKRVAVLSAQTNPTTFMNTDEYKEMEGAARALGVKLHILSARDPNTIDNAFLAMTRERPQALIVIPNPRYVQHRKLILERASQNRLPTIYPHSLFVENGGLMSYGVDFDDLLLGWRALLQRW